MHCAIKHQASSIFGVTRFAQEVYCGSAIPLSQVFRQTLADAIEAAKRQRLDCIFPEHFLGRLLHDLEVKERFATAPNLQGQLTTVGLPLAEVAVIEADEEAPNFTVFIGKKKVIGTDEARLVSVIYISDHVFTTKRGLPLWAFVCYDQLLNDELWNYCRRLEDKYSSKKIPAEAFVQRVLAEGAEVTSPDGRLGA